MGVALVAALSVLATVSTAIASPLPQQFLPPPLREHVVSFVPDLAESELVDGHKILPHLKLGEMLPAKRINIVDSAPDIAVQPSVLGGQEFSVSRFDTSQPHSVSRIRRHDRWGRGYGRFAEDEYLLFRSLGSKIGFDFDDCLLYTSRCV